MKKFDFDPSETTEGGAGPSRDLEAKLNVLLEWASNIDGVIGSVNHNAMMTVLSVDAVISLLIEKGLITESEFSATHNTLLRRATGNFGDLFGSLIRSVEDKDLDDTKKRPDDKKADD